MKKTIYLFSGLFTALFSTSCTKDYTCECTTSYTYNGVTSTSVDIDEVTIKEASKHAAQSNCLNREMSYTYNNGTTTYSYAFAQDCELK